MVSEPKEIDMYPALMTILSHRWIIVRNVVLTVFLVVILSFFLPRRYIAVTTLMPPQEDSKSPMAGMLSDVSLPGFSLPSSASSAEIMVELLKSRSVGERVLRRPFVVKNDTLPLYQHLSMPSVDIGLIRMRKSARFMLSKQNVISIIVELNDARLAADVANAYAEELDRINQEKSVSRAKNSRLYIESQLEQTRDKLAQATRALAEFQQENKAVSLENQMQAGIQQAGELKGEIIAKQVEIGVMLQSMKPENPLVIRAKSELQELNRQYRDLQFGEGKVDENSEFYLPFVDVPQVSLQLADLLREVKVQETVWQLLNQQFYQAKIEEARNTPTVQVLDSATPPPFPSSPNRKVLVIVFALLSLVLTIIWLLLLYSWQTWQQSPEKRQRLMEVKQELGRDTSFINRLRGRKK